MRPIITMEPVSSSGSCGTGTLDQLGNGVAQLRALALPMAHAFKLQTQRFLTFRYQRIVETDAFYKTAIAAIARIGYHHIEKRTILRTATGKTNDYHMKPLISPAKGRGFYDILGVYCNQQENKGLGLSIQQHFQDKPAAQISQNQQHKTTYC